MDRKRGDIVLHWAGQIDQWSRTLRLMLFKRVEGISTHYAQPAPLEWVEYKDNTLLPMYESTMEMQPGEAQQLMQILWDAGYRPNDGAGSTAEAVALRAHIASLEKSLDAAFALLNHQKEVRSAIEERTAYMPPGF